MLNITSPFCSVLISLPCFVTDGEFKPEADDSDDEETIEKEEAAGIDEVSTST